MPWRMCVAIGCLLWAVAAGAEIFRTVDENGNVVFSDTPPPPAASDDQSVQPIDLPEANTFEPPQREFRVRDLVPPTEDGDDAAAPVSYNKVQIVSPAEDEVIRNNAGNLTVVAATDPDLAPGHTLQLILDGELEGASANGSFELSYVDRGTHRIEVRVVDLETGEEFIRSAPITFHLLRYAKPRAG